MLEPLEGRTLLNAGPPAEPSGPGFGAAGDSLTDEYANDIDYAGTWVELLATEKDVNFGTHGDWGEPRTVGYEHNWAVSGATSASLLDGGQHTGLAQLIGTGAVSYAVLAIGQNDFAPGSPAYTGIYSDGWPQTQIDTYVDTVVGNIDTALDTLTATGGAIVLSNVIDYGLAPLTKIFYPSAESRERVTTVLVGLNDRLEDLASQYQIPMVDVFGLAQDFFGTGASPTVTQRVGGVSLFNAGGVDPHNAFIADGVHPHTIVQGLLGNLFLEGMSLGHGLDVGSLQFTEQQLLSAAGIGDEYVQDTFGLGYSDYVVLPTTIGPGVIDLGQVDFLSLEHLSLADGSLYARMKTTREGFLTLQVDVPKPSKSARLKLYGADPLETTGLTPLAQSALDEDGNQRIDWPTSAGTVYYVEVYGSNADFVVRGANLLRHDAANGIVTVHGTDGDDTFEFDASASRDVIINGLRYEFEDAEVHSVTFDGGQGFDVVEIRGSPGDDTLEAWPDRVVLSNGPNDATLDFNVEATDFEDLQAYAVGGGSDTAVLHGSSGNDKLKSYLSPDDDFVRLRAKDMAYSLRAKLFDEVAGDAGASGNDTAVFAGSDGDDRFDFDGATNTAQMRRPGRVHSATGFDRVIARAGQGDADVAYFTDMPGEGEQIDDVFYFKPHKTQLVGQAVNATARAFDEVHVENNQHGFGVARMYDTSEADHFEFVGNTARVYRRTGSELDLLYEAIAFDRVKAYRTTGNDTKDDASHTFGDELHLYGWEE